MESTSTVSSPADASARLSFAQKRDLLGQAVAAVVTTALIAAPLISPPPDGGGMPLAALPAASYAAPVASVAVADIAGSPILRELPKTTARKKLRGTPFNSMTLVPDARQDPGLAASEVPVTTHAAGEQPRKPLARRLTGWLTGNGTHSVRPFPSVPAGRP